MQKNSVVWVSHRGYHAQALENSRQAFDLAIQAGFTHLETDLRTCADGHIVLHHDPVLTRTFSSPLNVEKSRLKDLLAVTGPNGQQLLTFEAFIESYAGFSWTFDIKPESAGPTLRGLQQWAKRKNAESWLNEQARFLCWSAKAERYLHQLLPNVQSMARESECYRAGLAILTHMPWMGGIQAGRTYALPRYFAGQDLFRDQVVATYHRRGAKLLAYLPAQNEDAQAALSAGYDEILTNGLRLAAT